MAVSVENGLNCLSGHPKCISCGYSDCSFWFEGRRNLNINGMLFSVEGHVNRSMARRLVYDVGIRYIGVSIVVSPGFRSKKELNEFLTNYKKSNKYEPLSFDLYYIHNCSIAPQLNGYFLPSDSLINLFTRYIAYVETQRDIAMAFFQAQYNNHMMSMMPATLMNTMPSAPSQTPQPPVSDVNTRANETNVNTEE